MKIVPISCSSMVMECNFPKFDVRSLNLSTKALTITLKSKYVYSLIEHSLELPESLKIRPFILKKKKSILAILIKLFE